MVNPGMRREPARAGQGTRLLTCLVVAWAAGAGGCGFWDEFRAHDYSVKGYFFTKEDPLQVLAESSDNSKRARAYGNIKEPLAHGGNERDQEFAVTVLAKAAREEPQMWVRLQAIKSLSTFKDPRATTALIDAYYAGDTFPPDSRSVLRIKAINALGEMGNPQAIDLLVNVVKAPPIEARSESEKQLSLDERTAAAAALANFKTSRATEALVQVLKTERDVALRDCAHQSLQAVTDRKLPPDAQAWENLLYGETPPQVADQDRSKARILSPIIRTSGTNQQPR